MSLSGQSRRFDHGQITSGIPSGADIFDVDRPLSQVPIGDIRKLYQRRIDIIQLKERRTNSPCDIAVCKTQRGASRQRRPFLMTKIMPLITRRSSTLATPCDNGKYGSIRRICASDSNNKSARAMPPTPPLNQPANVHATDLMGPESKQLGLASARMLDQFRECEDFSLPKSRSPVAAFARRYSAISSAEMSCRDENARRAAPRPWRGAG